jgi:hypothetical protein
MNFAARPNKHTATRNGWFHHWVRPETLGNLALCEGWDNRDAAMLAATQGNSDPRLWSADFVEIKLHGARRQRATLLAWHESAEGPFIPTKVGRARRTSTGWEAM